MATRPGATSTATSSRRSFSRGSGRSCPTIVPQDWGGPIGLYWATRHPERVDGLFILNTFAHGWKPEALPPGKDEIPLPLPLRLFRTPGVGEVLVKGLDAFKRGFLFRQGVVHRERLTPTVKRAYRSVHQGWSERTPILVFPHEIRSQVRGRS